jgi:hypothetical protein
MPRIRPEQLILVEGLPGAGKSTTAHMLCRELQRRGLDARWWYEHETPHPVFDYPVVQEVLDHGRLQDGLFERALENWRSVPDLTGSGKWAVFESSFFQTPLHAMLLLDWTTARMTEYVIAAERAIAPAKPLLVVLDQEDIAAAIATVTAARGEWFPEFLDWRIRRSAHGRRRGLSGMPGIIEYFETYRRILKDVTTRLEIPKLVLEGGKATFVDRLVAFIGLPPLAPFETPAMDCSKLTGRYKDVGSDDVYDVADGGGHLYLGGAAPTGLVHEGGLKFGLLGTCVTLEFRPDETGAVRSLICRGNLPNLARDWVRSE